MNSKTKIKKVPLLDAKTLELPVDVALSTGLKKITEKILSNLEPEEAELLRLRFGIGGGRAHTLAELSTEWGVSVEKLGKIEAKALWHLRKLSLAAQRNDSEVKN
jgi:RNA polymerase primary sigma factor